MFERQILIPEPEEILARKPLPESARLIKKERDELVKSVIDDRSDKLLLIIGPCSAHEPAPVIKYIEKLGKLNEQVQDSLVIVPRI